MSFLGSFWDLDFDCEFWGRLFDCDFRLCIERPILSGGSAMDSPTRTFSFHPRRPLLLRSKGCPRSIDSLAYFSPMEFDPSIQVSARCRGVSAATPSRQNRCVTRRTSAPLLRRAVALMRMPSSPVSGRSLPEEPARNTGRERSTRVII